ncbi:MAG: AbiV family abortive infection protein [Bacteroidia bacterium]|nr:AbiV family abortive infection protein [Bacteroidia bacterium]
MEDKNWKKGVLSASKEKMFEISKLSYNNAKNLIESADLLISESKYSLAISLRILAIEELVKSLALLIESQGFNKRKEMKGFGGFFTSHDTKLKFCSQFYFNVGFLQITLNSNGILSLLEKSEIHIEELHELTEWLLNADDLKQRGFYVGYSDVSKKIIDPEECDLDNLKKSQIITSNLLTTSEMIFSKLDSEEVKEFINYLSYNFIDDILK